MRNRKGRPPIPKTLPGQYFVVEYSRDDDTYRIILDDEDHSNYPLPVQEQARQSLFDRWGIGELCDSCFGRAKDFGAAQCLILQRRVLTLAGDAKRENVMAKLREIEDGRKTTTNFLPR